MNVISESLKGLHSFTGVGIVMIEEEELAVCGSKQYNFGDGKKVKYAGEMIRRIEPEPERKAIFRCSIGVATTTVGQPILTTATGKALLRYGEKDGVPLGGEIDSVAGGSFTIHPGFVLYGMRNSTYESVALSSGDIASFLAMTVDYGPYYYLALKPE